MSSEKHNLGSTTLISGQTMLESGVAWVMQWCDGICQLVTDYGSGVTDCVSLGDVACRFRPVSGGFGDGMGVASIRSGSAPLIC